MQRLFRQATCRQPQLGVDEAERQALRGLAERAGLLDGVEGLRVAS